ncbi:MAG: agmatinase [Gammaproteobacteria bacterium]|nr:agmatinase [Gammaproteobacteria bacterium]
MDQKKLEALRKKYKDQDYHEVDDPEFQKAMLDASDMLSGIATLLDAPYRDDLEGLDIALIGVPFDSGVVHRTGARFRPRAIRDISMAVGPFNHQTRINPDSLCAIADIGDVPLHGFSLEEGIQTIEEYFHKVIDAGVIPISAGGDHSVTYPIMKAVGRDKPVGMVHIDAHCDTMGAFEDHKFHHGGPFRHAVLDGVLDPERCVQIGIRGAAEVFWEFSHESGMTVIPVQDFHNMGVDAVISKTREVIGDGPTYITFDVDGLDPVYAPGTGTPEIGGLSTADAIQLLRGLRGLNFVGGDLVEVAPAYDATINTAQVGKQMMFEILCLVAESRARR